MEEKNENVEKEFMEAIPNPNSYVMTREQYEEIKNRKLTKEEIELRQKIKKNSELIKKQIKNETEICK